MPDKSWLDDTINCLVFNEYWLDFAIIHIGEKIKKGQIEIQPVPIQYPLIIYIHHHLCHFLLGLNG